MSKTSKTSKTTKPTPESCGWDFTAYRAGMEAWQRRTWAASVEDACAHAHGFQPWMTALQVDAAANDRRLIFAFVWRCNCAPAPGYLGPRGGGPAWTEEEQPAPAAYSAVCNGPRLLRERLEAAHGALGAARRAAAAAPGDVGLAAAARAARGAYRAARAAWRAAVKAEALRQMARDEAPATDSR